MLKALTYLIQEPLAIGEGVDFQSADLLHADLLFANGSDRLRSCMVVPIDLEATLINGLCDGDTTMIKLSTKNQRKVPSGIFIRAVQRPKVKGMGVIAGCEVNDH